MVRFEEGGPSPFIIPATAEHPISRLGELLKQPQPDVGFSPLVESIRLSGGLYKLLLKQTIDNLVHNHKKPYETIDKVYNLFIKSKPVLPTMLCLLNLVDPGWSRSTDLHDGLACSISRKDVFSSRLVWQLLAKRWGVLKGGGVALIVGKVQWKYLLRLYLIQLCGPAMHDYVAMVVDPMYVAVDPIEIKIQNMHAQARGKRKRADEALNYGECSLESAPACIHRMFTRPMKNVARFHLAVIVAQIVRERNLSPDALLGEIMKTVALSPNKCRDYKIKGRITAELKKTTGLYDDTKSCASRCHPDFSTIADGIQCPYDSPEFCIRGRRGDISAPTIAKVWLFSDPKGEGTTSSTVGTPSGSPRGSSRDVGGSSRGAGVSPWLKKWRVTRS